MLRPSLRRLAGGLAAVAAGVALMAGAAATVPLPQRPFAPGQCGPVDPTYAQLAARTGGQVFVLSPSDLAAAGQALVAVDRDLPLLLETTGDTSGTVTPLSLPVDTSISRLVISSTFEGTGGTLDVLAPDGSDVAASEHVTDSRTACGRVISIGQPAPGIWRASLAPTGPFRLLVHAKSDLDLRPVLFVGAQDGSEGPLDGSPVLGRPARVRAGVTVPGMRSYEFLLLSEAGTALKNVTLSQDAHGVWDGTFDPPQEPFRLAVTGEDSSGRRFQRSSKLFQAETVEVLSAAPALSLPRRSETRVAFTIRNVGPAAARFAIAAIDDLRLVARVEPASVDLDAGAAQETSIWLHAPPGIAAGSESLVRVTASTDAPRRTSNTAAVRIRIE